METPELIQKVHEDIEGRYDLTAEDLYYIHAALCELDALKKELEELKKLPEAGSKERTVLIGWLKRRLDLPSHNWHYIEFVLSELMKKVVEK